MDSFSTWAPWKLLEQFDRDIGQVIQISTSNSPLARAWDEAIRLLAKEDPLLELKEKIRLYRLERSSSKARGEDVDVELPKRKGTPTFRYPPGSIREEADDDESDELFLRPGCSAGVMVKEEPSDSHCFANLDEYDRRRDSFYLESGHSRKKSRLDAVGRFSMRPSLPSKSATPGLGPVQ